MTRHRLAFIALGLLGLWHLGLRWNSLSLPLISDEGEYAYEARLLSDSGLPYRDAFDQKPPAVFFIYRLAFGLFGTNARAPRLLAVLASWATMVLLFYSTPAAWSWTARLAAPAAFGALSTAPIGDLGFTANTEIFLCLFTSLAAWCLLRSWSGRRPLSWAAAAGLASGVALMTKQTAFWSVAGFLAMSVAGRANRAGRLKAGAAYLAATAVAPITCWLYFASRGGAGYFIEQAFTRNMDYSSLVATSLSLPVQFAWLVKTLGPLLMLVGWPAFLLAGFGLVFSTTKAGANQETMVTLWLGTALVGVCTGFFFFPHYFLQALPPLALAVAMGASWSEKQVRALSKGPWLALALSLYPALAQAKAYFVYPPERLARELLYPNALFESQAIGEFLGQHTTPEDRIYVFGSEPQIYFYADRRAATPHIFVYPLTLFPRDRGEIDRELSDLDLNPPKYIVYVNVPASTLVGSKLGQAFRNGVLQLLGLKYRWVGTVDMRGPRTKYLLLSSGDGLAGAAPDWSAEPQIFLFERK